MKDLSIQLTVSTLCILILIVVLGKVIIDKIDAVNEVNNQVPSCQEDEIIVGTGDYSGGFWTSYECGHDSR